jgi:soluble lytic murein transglycosylase-like protein
MIDRYDPIFKEIGQEQSIDPALLKGIAISESSLNWMAYRFGRGERRFYQRYIEDKGEWMVHPYYHSPWIIAASWGLMQLMYTTAVLVGFAREGAWHVLLDPATNIRLGASYYKLLSNRYGNASSALAAYNAGVARVDPESGKFQNQWYVDRVWKHAERCRSGPPQE